MKAKDLIKQYESGKRDFQNADLQYADLSGADLRGADLWGANLTRANLWRAYLWGANLRGADLRGADLWGANLRGANLQGANLSSADLSSANLTGADLWGANLRGANLRGADLSSANLLGTEIDDGKTITCYFTRTRIGSDSGELQVAYNNTEIWFRRGCSGWLTPDEFLEQVATTHGDNLHSQIYRLTVDYCVEIVKLERLKDAI